MRIVGIGGEPATGKSFLMGKIRERLGLPGALRRSWEKVMVWSEFADSKACVLGIYDGGAYGGTDRLSMAVTPVAVRWLPIARAQYPGYTIFFEGDRLFTANFIAECRKYAELCDFLILSASDNTKATRRFARSDTKPASWLQGRVTKYQRIANDDKQVRIFRHETEVDTELLLNMLLPK